MTKIDIISGFLRDSVLQLLSRLQAEQMQRKPGDIPAAEKSENRFQ